MTLLLPTYRGLHANVVSARYNELDGRYEIINTSPKYKRWVSTSYNSGPGATRVKSAV